MNKIQLTALEQSISHWDRVCQGLEPSNGASGCACCKTFFDCHECPIMATTGLGACEDTPYRKFSNRFYVDLTIPQNIANFSPLYKARINAGIDAAEAELCFLLSLLPPDHKWFPQAPERKSVPDPEEEENSVE